LTNWRGDGGVTVQSCSVQVFFLKIEDCEGEGVRVLSTEQSKTRGPAFSALFSLVIDAILKKLDIRGNISMQLRQLIAYADDILITECTKQSLMDTFQQLKDN